MAEKFLAKFPKLKIVGTSNKEWNDPSIIDDVTQAKPDIILVALGKLVQEEWIVNNLPNLPASFAIGLGGTLDYIAGARRKPPQFIRRNGLEWLYRLITQPTRVRRIFNATWGLIVSLVRVKSFSYMPLRTSAVAVVVNKDRKILLCKQVDSVTKKFYPDKPGMVDWQFPQGGLELDEEVVSGATRELQEETGIASVKVLGIAKYEKRFEWQNALRPFTTSHYKARGGHLRTVFFEFTGDESEVKLDQKELVEHQWVDPSEVLNIMPPIRHEHAAAVLAELAEIQVN